MTGTQISYYFICHRKLWLFVNQIDMEQTSDIVSIGKFISESTYEREKHEIHISDEEDDIVIDFYDSKNRIIHEVKKSDKMEETHIWQVKFYISVLEKKGIIGVTGEIDYPKLRQKIKVELTDKDRSELKLIKENIIKIISSEVAPDVINKSFCKKCSYYELCYV
ncbi:CRISPR-associated protein Cas4 [Stygiobacter electus]|uniref:CRISPR-associated exonuclease Cas4 n=1 Tax=Stygiobacter electus TaxID=3032292 RepID=A0AAE3NYD6_9BACT|nr:CRISPR-associated protein Cas4 [Stygiobacter electus]MDF1612366.1 CRISPR-associated protein Cas4 [Stygiobacter electus]